MTHSKPNTSFGRGDFLNQYVLAVGAPATIPIISAAERGTLLPSIPGTKAGRILRGTEDGRVLVSLDGGKTWSQLTSFGDGYAVLDVSDQGGLLLARVRFKNRTFYLKSVNGKTWYSQAYKPPRRQRNSSLA